MVLTSIGKDIAMKSAYMNNAHAIGTIKSAETELQMNSSMVYTIISQTQSQEANHSDSCAG